MTTTFVKHYRQLSRAKGREISSRELKDRHLAVAQMDLSGGHSTFWKHYAAAVSQKANHRLHIARQPQVKTRVVYRDKAAEARWHATQAMNQRLVRLEHMAKEIDASPEGKELQAEQNKHDAQQSYQKMVDRRQQEEAQKRTQARQQLNGHVW
jgi:hypothetical protein